ncbi:MAG: ABC transporter permease, partial [Tissierellia bacterium]|nr:ABC transporter permease [Tissierellia bacterium]
LFAKLATSGMNPIISCLIVFVVGTFTGLLTALLHIKLKIEALLAGILSMTILYSINLRINGKPNVPLSGAKSIFDINISGNSYVDKIIVVFVLVMIIKFVLDWFLKTETGYLVIATGDNKSLVRSLGENSNKYIIIGLMLSNGLIALSGALLAQSSGFADITMGVSIIVVALASIIIGDTIFRDDVVKGTTKVIIGAIIYKIIGAIALKLGLKPTDFRMVNGIIVVLFIAYNNLQSGFLAKRKNARRAEND